ncbi:MAG: MASE3 domain-containing protein, partial [Thermodesulfobacteriota bacterium]
MINGDLNNMDDEKNNYRPILIGISVLLGLWVISSYSFLLFHSIAEIFSIVVACSLFMFAWNSRQFMKNDYFIFIGIAYLFIAFLDLAHLLSYK